MAEQVKAVRVNEPDEKQDKPRSGVVTGARIVLMLAKRPMSAGQLSEALGHYDGYVRRILGDLIEAGVLVCETIPQWKTPPLKVYSLKEKSDTGD